MNKLLSDEKKKEAESVLTYYKKAYVCRKCRIIFGSDKRDEDAICPVCQKEESMKRGRKKNPEEKA